MVVTTTHKLLTDSWTADVEALEAAVEGFETFGTTTNPCHVAFFEIVRDRQLHVNVTHKYQTRTVRGWAGPASLPEGFVHNRRFDDSQPAQIIRHIREMVFASRIR